MIISLDSYIISRLTKLDELIDPDTRKRAYCVLLSATCSINTYVCIGPISAFSILTPVFCLFMPIFNLILYYSTFNYYGGIYAIKWFTKSAIIISNDIIYESIIIKGRVFKVKLYILIRYSFRINLWPLNIYFAKPLRLTVTSQMMNMLKTLLKIARSKNW